MFFPILTFLFCIYNRFSKKERINTYLLNNKKLNKFSGNDERYKILGSEIVSQMQIYNFTKVLEKKLLLQILENNNITLNNKVSLLRDNSIQSYNIKAGGLISDFD